MEYLGMHAGYGTYYSNISYCCPDLALWGYSSERSLARAINRKVKANEVMCGS